MKKKIKNKPNAHRALNSNRDKEEVCPNFGPGFVIREEKDGI